MICLYACLLQNDGAQVLRADKGCLTDEVMGFLHALPIPTGADSILFIDGVADTNAAVVCRFIPNGTETLMAALLFDSADRERLLNDPLNIFSLKFPEHAGDVAAIDYAADDIYIEKPFAPPIINSFSDGAFMAFVKAAFDAAERKTMCYVLYNPKNTEPTGLILQLFTLLPPRITRYLYFASCIENLDVSENRFALAFAPNTEDNRRAVTELAEHGQMVFELPDGFAAIENAPHNLDLYANVLARCSRKEIPLKFLEEFYAECETHIAPDDFSLASLAAFLTLADLTNKSLYIDRPDNSEIERARVQLYKTSLAKRREIMESYASLIADAALRTDTSSLAIFGIAADEEVFIEDLKKTLFNEEKYINGGLLLIECTVAAIASGGANSGVVPDILFELLEFSKTSVTVFDWVNLDHIYRAYIAPSAKLLTEADTVLAFGYLEELRASIHNPDVKSDLDILAASIAGMFLSVCPFVELGLMLNALDKLDIPSLAEPLKDRISNLMRGTLLEMTSDGIRWESFGETLKLVADALKNDKELEFLHTPLEQAFEKIFDEKTSLNAETINRIMSLPPEIVEHITHKDIAERFERSCKLIAFDKMLKKGESTAIKSLLLEAIDSPYGKDIYEVAEEWLDNEIKRGYFERIDYSLLPYIFNAHPERITDFLPRDDINAWIDCLRELKRARISQRRSGNLEHNIVLIMNVNRDLLRAWKRLEPRTQKLFGTALNRRFKNLITLFSSKGNYRKGVSLFLGISGALLYVLLALAGIMFSPDTFTVFGIINCAYAAVALAFLWYLFIARPYAALKTVWHFLVTIVLGLVMGLNIYTIVNDDVFNNSTAAIMRNIYFIENAYEQLEIEVINVSAIDDSGVTINLTDGLDRGILCYNDSILQVNVECRPESEGVTTAVTFGGHPVVWKDNIVLIKLSDYATGTYVFKVALKDNAGHSTESSFNVTIEAAQ